MTGGVLSAKEERRHGYVAFRPPSLWRRMGQTRKARAVRDSAAKKIAARCHVSMAFARAELMDFVGLLLADKKKERAVLLAAELALEAEEIALLLGSSTGTKKVQSIFEEASRIRAAEEYEEIEMGWQETAQHSLGSTGTSVSPKPQISDGRVEAKLPAAIVGPEGTVSDSGSGSVVSEMPKAKPAASDDLKPDKVSGQEITQPQPGQPRKRGRPKKAESEAKPEKKAETKAATGKKQKSLFDF